jgi:outer membrane protein OmpA-like peptidoglycan-associated protein/outer membrane protein W
MLGVLAMMPSLAVAQNAAGPKSDDYFNFIEVNVYGGYGNYAKIPSSPQSKIEGGGLMGARLTENLWNYFSLEQDVGFYSYHRLRFSRPTENGTVVPSLPLHVYQASFNGVLHITPRDSKIRPFVTVGIGAANYAPNDSAKKTAASLPAAAGFNDFGSRSGFEANYGAGLKIQTNPRFGLRFDVRGYVGTNPSFGLANLPSVNGGAAMPSGKVLNGVEATGGLTIYFGRVGEKPVPPPPPPPPPPPSRPAPHSLNAGTISASATSVCPGDAVRLTSNASDPQGHRLNYQWNVNGNNQGGNSSDYTFTPTSSGDFRIGLRISDTAATDAASPVDANPLSIHVGVYNRPNVSGVTANPSELERGQTAALHVNATGSECSGRLNYNWAASEGAISGTGPDAQFNSNSVSFNEADRSRPQSKQITVTATVTDAKGGSGTASTNLTVNYPAQVKHFGDIVFPKDSARVNNCGKRILIEQLYPLLTANSNYDVVLVGHIDSSEAPRGRSRRNRDLDRRRVMQTAAVLSGGTGTCASLDTTRIKGAWVGTTQESESLPTSCAISTAAPKERRGAAIQDTNEAKNRRVEIWLVPKGMPLPSAARDAKDLPDAELKRIGCPR